jgi:hypothetical protein
MPSVGDPAAINDRVWPLVKGALAVLATSAAEAAVLGPISARLKPCPSKKIEEFR